MHLDNSLHVDARASRLPRGCGTFAPFTCLQLVIGPERVALLIKACCPLNSKDNPLFWFALSAYPAHNSHRPGVHRSYWYSQELLAASNGGLLSERNTNEPQTKRQQLCN